MKGLVKAIADEDYFLISELIEKMKRLWNNGLVQRRENEAALVRNSSRAYSSDDLIEI